MKLHRISIKNYRSISKKTTFELSDFTSLIGPNNEGKTNILRALTLAFAIIHQWKHRPIPRKQLEGMYARRFYGQLRLNSGTNLISDFDFERDYPKHIKKVTSIEIELIFQLTETEIEEFKNETRMNNNGELPLTIKIEPNTLSLVINKRGRGNITYNRNIRKIANYIDTRIGILSVPAIRDSTQMLEVAQDFAQRHLQASLFANEHYQDLMQKIKQIEDDYLNALSDNITKQIQGYAQNISEVELIRTNRRSTMPLIERLEITDNVRTSSTEKGEGLQSLIAIGLIQEATKHLGNHKAYILAIDEPEAHLHPDAVRAISNTLRELATTQQVIVATHSPILVGQTRLHTNILVEDSTAQMHPSLTRIRQCLGIQLSDSLFSAPICILVEGLTDQTIYRTLLCERSAKVKQGFNNNQITILPTHGTTKLTRHIEIQRQFLNRILILLDKDQAGEKEVASLKKENVVDDSEIRTIPALNRSPDAEVELEDMLTSDFIIKALNNQFGNSFKLDDFKPVDTKWSSKFKRVAKVAGLNEDSLDSAKTAICRAVEQEGLSALRKEYYEYIDRINQTLEGMLDETNEITSSR
ncbi:ATP-dependent nuclease [Schaalia odontolytica]|uniref:Predicted ATPase n=1 Tax=Schaalia odontolytica TaxID=1660 RepID=A0A2X0TYU4_9ACTO|nr:AAA family ATPase [Schaalia odontolytica]WMS27771.1 AAA family ATPase [Schaalia odontolytica]SPT54689.1 Predicted ATPase [Schaalia odontolytica]